MAKLNLSDVSGNLSAALYNANNVLIEAAMEKTLSRDGTTPNIMETDLDMNSNDVNNINRVFTEELFLRGVQVYGLTQFNPESINSLLDVEITSVADLELLQYDALSSKWINQTITEVGLSELGHTHTASEIVDFDPDNYLLDTSDVFTGDLTIAAGDLKFQNENDGIFWGGTGTAYILGNSTTDDITLSVDTSIMGQILNLGANGGGDSLINFYDDLNDTFRSIFWDSSAQAFFFEDNTGTFQELGAGGIGGSITDNQIAVGAVTADEIEGNASFTFDASTNALRLGTQVTGQIEMGGTAESIRWNNTLDTIDIYQDSQPVISISGTQDVAMPWGNLRVGGTGATNGVVSVRSSAATDALVDFYNGVTKYAELRLDNANLDLDIRTQVAGAEVAVYSDLGFEAMRWLGTNGDTAMGGYLTQYNGGTPTDTHVLTWVTANGRAEFVAAASGGIGGSITDNQIAVGALAADDIEGSANLTWDGTDLGINGNIELTDLDTIKANDNASSWYLSGGATATQGFNMRMGGQTGTFAYDMEMRQDATRVVKWDNTSGSWDFYTGFPTPTTAFNMNAAGLLMSNKSSGICGFGIQENTGAYYMDNGNNTYMWSGGTADEWELVVGNQAILTLGASGAPADNEVLAYISANGRAEWKTLTEIGGGSGGGWDVVTETTTTRTATSGEFILADDDTAAGDITITLPAAAADAYVGVKRIGSNEARQIIVDGNGAELIDGLTEFSIAVQYESITLVSDGTGWYIT